MKSNVNHKPTSQGVVYLTGAGPGDPGLITLKALDKIKIADVIIYDYLAGQELTALARPDAELIYAGKTGGKHTLKQADINALLVAKAREGKKVVRLKGGDPFLFGRGGEEAEELVAAGIAYEVIPGVTSAIAAPAYAGIPVTHRDHSSMVTFVTGHEDPEKESSAINWEVLAKSPGTLVFLMGMTKLANICTELIRKGMKPETSAAIVEWGTTPRQTSLYSTLEQLPSLAEKKGVRAPAVVIVGSVTSLATKLAWFENKPLFGKKILITRTREQSGKLAGKIMELGGQPVLFPTISIVDPEDFAPLDHSISKIQAYDWIIFTSVNGVERFFERLMLLAEDVREMKGPRIAAIGPATATALRARGLKVDIMAAQFVAEGLIEAFREQPLRGKKILIPRAERARDLLPETLEADGAEVEVVGVYRTEKPNNLDVKHIISSLSERIIDAIAFTSSSTVSHFVDIIGPQHLAELLHGVTIVSIGPITTNTAETLGLKVAVEAPKYTIEGLVEAMVEYYRQ